MHKKDKKKKIIQPEASIKSPFGFWVYLVPIHHANITGKTSFLRNKVEIIA